ncbi:MAG: zinc ribbon domain-containing protein [Candidatus Eisenbacteria sp.]|nr:zinc ribbon domain-containing protein [Candidatus Eisenbacteria bacterium]
MPLYEYECNKCGNKFEYLQGHNETDVRIVCPKCDSENVNKIFSIFSTTGCGGCGTPSSFG